MNFKHYCRDRVALALPKLSHKKEHFRLNQKLLALIKKVCNAVIVEVVFRSELSELFRLKGLKAASNCVVTIIRTGKVQVSTGV